MRKIFLSFSIIFFFNPANAVTTRMFRVLDTCARYRLNELDAFQALEKLKIENNINRSNRSKSENKKILFCVYT